jgi:hypothetical protein
MDRNVWVRFVIAGPKTELRAVVREMEEILRPDLYRDGRWHMDYVRLRIKAIFNPDLPHSAQH